MPEDVTIPSLTWPQDEDAVPPGMESLISAPLVKTSEKEEEQVGLWGGPSGLGGVGSYPSGGIWGAGAGHTDPQPAAPART